MKQQAVERRRTERHRLYRRNRQGLPSVARPVAPDVSREGVQRDLLPLIEGSLP